MNLDLAAAVKIRDQHAGIDTARSVDPEQVLSACPEELLGLRQQIEMVLKSRSKWKSAAERQEAQVMQAEEDNFKVEHILRNTVALQQSRLRRLERDNEELKAQLALEGADVFEAVKGMMGQLTPKVPMPPLDSERRRQPFRRASRPPDARHKDFRKAMSPLVSHASSVPPSREDTSRHSRHPSWATPVYSYNSASAAPQFHVPRPRHLSCSPSNRLGSTTRSLHGIRELRSENNLRRDVMRVVSSPSGSPKNNLPPHPPASWPSGSAVPRPTIATLRKSPFVAPPPTFNDPRALW